MTKPALIALAVLVALNVGTGWLLKRAYEENGALENANAALTATLKEKDDALKDRARTDSDIRRLPPGDIRDRLR